MGKKPVVLVLDNNDDVVQALTALLETSGYTPRSAHDGREALAIIEKENPPVGLIDLMLPGMSGLEVMERISKTYPDMMCIVITALASSDSAIKAINLGAYSYMTKPYDVDQLLLTVRRAYEKYEADKAFRSSEEKYRALFENAHEAIMISELESGIIIDINKEVEKLLGYPRREMRGRHRADLYPKDLREHYEELFLNHIEVGYLHDFEADAVVKSGSSLPVHVRTLTTMLGDLKVVQMIIWDATERKKAEEEITQLIEADDDLKRFLMGREMKIVEMKKEINHLRKEQGKGPKYIEESSVIERLKG